MKEKKTEGKKKKKEEEEEEEEEKNRRRNKQKTNQKTRGLSACVQQQNKKHTPCFKVWLGCHPTAQQAAGWFLLGSQSITDNISRPEKDHSLPPHTIAFTCRKFASSSRRFS